MGRGKKKVTPRRIPSIFQKQPVNKKLQGHHQGINLFNILNPKTSQMNFYHHRLYHLKKSETERLIEEIKQLRTKNERFQKKNNILVEEN